LKCGKANKRKKKGKWGKRKFAILREVDHYKLGKL
jgi:hypothetical protein